MRLTSALGVPLITERLNCLLSEKETNCWQRSDHTGHPSMRRAPAPSRSGINVTGGRRRPETNALL